MITTAAQLAGLRATVMGLGLHGGGLAAAQFLLRHGARVTVTDLRDAAQLAGSVEQVSAARLVLGRHEPHDFTDSDLIVKNPGVPADSPYLQQARAAGVPVESDISLFLRLYPEQPLLAVTGSRGKSTTAAALHAGLRAGGGRAELGGNITRPPLAFAEQLDAATPVVLELSSWQLGDLPAAELLRATVAILTTLLPDHQDRYASMRHYIADKERIFAGQRGTDTAVVGADALRLLAARPRARLLVAGEEPLGGRRSGAWLDGDGRVWARDAPGAEPQLLVAQAALPGRHNLLNLAAAGLGLLAFGVSAATARGALEGFSGLEHRLEPVPGGGTLRFINDSASTVPEATAAALASYPPPVTLIAGGADKQLDFSPLREPLGRAAAVVLLDGSATAKLREVVAASGVPYFGPFAALEPAVREAIERTPAGGTVLFSPGATSFGMFAHEFDRGRQFKRLVAQLTG